MRRIYIIPLILLAFNQASAQNYYYTAQAAPAQQQPASPSTPGTMYYAGQPTYAPQPYQPQQVTPQAPAQQPAPAAQPQPWDYGHSVTTDIRQMNF